MKNKLGYLVWGLWFSVAVIYADQADLVSRFASGKGPDPEVRVEPDFFREVQRGVQITEMGNLRVVLVFKKGAEELKDRVAEFFSDADFRVFPGAVIAVEDPNPTDFGRIGSERYSDLVVVTKVTSREKSKLGPLSLFESEATIQIFSPVSGELLVSETVRSDGKRLADRVAAIRIACEAAVDAALKGVIPKALEKSHRIIIHEAQFKGVVDHQHLLEIMEYTARLEGVYHVRQITYDKDSRIAVVEILGEPQTESFWRAYLQNMPKKELLLIDGQEPKIIKKRQKGTPTPKLFEK